MFNWLIFTSDWLLSTKLDVVFQIFILLRLIYYLYLKEGLYFLRHHLKISMYKINCYQCEAEYCTHLFKKAFFLSDSPVLKLCYLNLNLHFSEVRRDYQSRHVAIFFVRKFLWRLDVTVIDVEEKNVDQTSLSLSFFSYIYIIFSISFSLK